ncbi:MAG: bifunctional DNA primase/polymerase [Coriobacteriia bacterium]|nr:bifunctional DNA primase/polymerase [Coriobacteriia bacterium]
MIEQMKGFRTHNKVPCEEWRSGANRSPVELLFHGGAAQVGIVPAEHGCVVLDVDVKGEVDGTKSISKLPELPNTLRYKTASGGWHVWYKVPSDIVIPQRKLTAGVDVRYADGYVCVGADYEVLSKHYIATAPGFLVSMLTLVKPKKAYPSKRTASSSMCYNLSPLPKGNRNNMLYSWGYGLLNGVEKGELSIQDLSELVHLRGRISGLPYQECQTVLSSLLASRK